MGFEDLTNNLSVISQLLDPDSHTVSSDVAATGIDGANAGSVMHIIGVGDLAEYSANHHTRLVIQESASLGSGYTDVTDADMVEFTIDGTVTAMEDATTGLLKALDDTADQNHVYTAEYHGQSRYSRILLEVTGTRTTGDFVVEVLVNKPSRKGASGVLGSN